MENYIISESFTLKKVQNTIFNVLMAFSSCIITVENADEEEIKLIECRKTMDAGIVSITFGDSTPNIFEYPSEIGKFVDTIPYVFDNFANTYNLNIGEKLNFIISADFSSKNPLWDITTFDSDEIDEEELEDARTSIIDDRDEYLKIYEDMNSSKNATQVRKFSNLVNRFKSFMSNPYEKKFSVRFVCKNEYIGTPTHIMISIDKAITFIDIQYIFTIYRPDLSGYPLICEPVARMLQNHVIQEFVNSCEIAKDICRKITDNKYCIFYYEEEK